VAAAKMATLRRIVDIDKPEGKNAPAILADSEELDSAVPLANGRAGERSTSAQSEVTCRLPIATSKFPDLYTVVVEEQPAGFRFAGDIVLVVNKYCKLHQTLLPDSRVVKVNDVAVNYDTFEHIYISTPTPLTLTLERPLYIPAGQSTSDPDGEAKMTTKLLTNFMLHYFSVFIDFFGILVTGPVLPYLMPVMGFNEIELGLLTSIYNAASVPGALFCGWLAGRCGTRPAMLFSLFGSAATLLAQGALIQVCVASGDPTDRKYFNLFLAIRVLAGLTGSSMPVTMTFIGMKCPPKQKPKYMAMAGVCLTMAVMIGPMVGGTLANFTPQFAVPFYAGGAVALIGFLVALLLLDTARPPSRKGKQRERASKPLVCMTVVSLFIQVIYGAYIIMGVAYYMWRFGMKPEEVGSVLSLHGVIQSVNNVFTVPWLMKRLGQYRAYMLGCLMLVVGTAAVGFMDTWWSFQLIWSPIAGMGWSLARVGTSVICDRFAAPSSKPIVHAVVFTFEQIGLFASGIIYGTLLAFAKENDNGSFFWLPVSGISLVFSFCYLLIWRCVIAPHEKRKKHSEEKAQLAANQHKIDYVCDDDPSEAEYLEYGRFMVDLLRKRNWYWRSKSFFVKSIVEDLFVELPTDTLDHRMEIVWDVAERAKQAKEALREIDAFYDELSKLHAASPKTSL